MTDRQRRRALLLLWLAGAALVGCGGGDGGGSVQTTSTGQLRVALTDQASTYDAVVLSIREVRLVPVGSESLETDASWTVLASFSPARVIDVATLSFQQEVLGTATVPAGTYHQLRLVLDANPATGDPVNYVIKTGTTTKLALKTPSGQESGLKINGTFTVEPGILNALVLDFDPGRAIVEAGASSNIILKPTGIRLVDVAAVLTTYGSLSGIVLPASAWSTAVVYVYPVGSTTAIAAGSVNPDDGSFRVFLPAGQYYVTVVATGFATFDSQLLVPTGVYTVVIGSEFGVGVYTVVP